MNDRPSDGFRHCPGWVFAAAALVVAQAGLALALFGPRPWAAVADDRPVLSGRHPLHLYHGSLGAAAFRDRGVTTCYDPQFQAGYPKTPVFDGGSRPAELALFVAGGKYRPGAYKVGLFLLLLTVPVAFVAAGRGAGLPPGAAVLCGAGGVLLGWSWPVRRMIAEGQIDVLAAGLCAVVFVPWLARFARTLGVDAWVVLAATAAGGWYFHPLVWLGVTPVVLVYYLVFAPRQGPAFHLALAGIAFAGVAPNAWWLADWGKYWWLRQPAAGDPFPVPGWRTVLGSPADYPPLCGCLPGGPGLVLAGVLGAVLMWRAGHRAAAGLGLLAAGLTVLVARVAGAWPAVPPDVPGRTVVLAAGFLVPPAAFALWRVLGVLRIPVLGAAAAVLGLVLAGGLDGPGRPLAKAFHVAADPLLIGFTHEQREIITVLKQHTTADARILWDETADDRAGWNWSALLPVYTERAFLGGLDPESGVEHAYCAMGNRSLTGRRLNDWSDADLAAFCRWYNVGWVVARTTATAERWGRCPMARPVATLAERGRPVVVFALDRPRSFVLSGSATWESADARRVVLTNVVPNADGEVVLSLHALEGMRVLPSYIQVKEAKDPTGRDPIDHVRLQAPGPVPRVTLVWENP